MSRLRLLVLTMSFLLQPMHLLAEPTSKTTLNDLQGDIRDDRDPKGTLSRVRGFRDLANRYFADDPNDGFGHRTMGDAYHLMGHVAEQRRQYDLAIRFHQAALTHFLKTSMASFTSPNGFLHSYEHLFQSMFDAGEAAFLKKEFSKAKEYFFQARNLYREVGLGEIYLGRGEAAEWEVYGSLPVNLRYPHLLKYLDHLKKEQVNCKFIL